MVHIAHCLARRTNTSFSGDPDDDTDMFHPAGCHRWSPARPRTAWRCSSGSTGAWHRAVRGLDTEALQAPLGPRGAYFADDPMIALVVHVNREVMHHGGEIGVLRDLYRRRSEPG